MLNKDQYNEEEYNDYYRQEVEGAEIEDSEEEGTGIISKLIILLVLLALSIAGFFGYKAMSSMSKDNTNKTSLKISEVSSLPQSIQEKVEVEVEVAKSTKVKPASNVQSLVEAKVIEATTTQEKMSPEEVATVVSAVMEKIKQQKSLDSSTQVVSATQENKLIAELSASEMDSVSTDLIKDLENINIDKDAKMDTNKKQVDVYNKVNVQNVSGSDILSQLSEQINEIMQEGNSKNKAVTYTNSLKSEVGVRKNEMRIIVVQKGDTLGKLAERAYGNVMEYKKIYRANPELTQPDHIYIGQKLRIPN